MTKEELEKEAEEWLCNNLHSASEEDFIKAMVDIAEPREKRIAELEKEKAKWEVKFNDSNRNWNELVTDWVKDLEREVAELKEDNADLKQSLDWANEREREDCKRIAELEEQISVLLSCKNCPENKGGYICEKEYENKCLSQKIQYIKELQEENEKLEKEIEISQRCWQEQKNISLDANCKLHKSKELLRELYVIVKVECSPFFKDEHKTILTEIKEFLKEE